MRGNITMDLFIHNRFKFYEANYIIKRQSQNILKNNNLRYLRTQGIETSPTKRKIK